MQLTGSERFISKCQNYLLQIKLYCNFYREINCKIIINIYVLNVFVSMCCNNLHGNIRNDDKHYNELPYVLTYGLIGKFKSV